MGQVIGDLLPLAVGVAISPIPIIAVILMLLAPKAGGTSAGFLVGWVVGIVVATTLFLLLAGTLDLGSSGEPSAAASWVKLVLGALLLLLAAIVVPLSLAAIWRTISVRFVHLVVRVGGAV